jgi:hypothetical protein
MATYPPPTYTEPLSIFNPIYFESGETLITIEYANKNYLRFPVAQGTETLQQIIVNGTAAFNNNINVGSTSTANNTPTLTTNKTNMVIGTGGSGKMDIECPVNVGGFGSVNLTTAPLNLNGGARINQSQAPSSHNNLWNTDFVKPITMTSATAGDRLINTGYLQLANVTNLANNAGLISGSNSGVNYQCYNSNSSHIMETANGQGATPTLQIYDGTKNILFLANGGSGSYNPATDAGNEVILAKGSNSNTETLELTTWSATNSSVKIAPTSVSMGAGGSTNTPTTSVLCNGTNVVINPSLAFPDGKVQNSAFTGGGAFAGSYTLANITLDSNGKITAISNGSSTNQFQPTFHNLANYQTGTTGYSQGAYINWSGGWGALDYVIIRYRVQVNWGNSGSGWQNYATSAGELLIRPYFSTAGVMGSLSSPNQFWTTNSGSLFGNVGKLLYSTGVSNNGSQGYFFIYGNGGSGGGAAGSIQLMCDAPGVSGGWQFTQTYEYLSRSTSGGSITFTNGAGGGTATTNNSLP